MTETAFRAPRRDAQKNRSRLLQAAEDLLATHGELVPLEDIARAAGVSRTTLFRHFKQREDLVAALIDRNTALIEMKASELYRSDRPEIALELFDFVFDQARRNRRFTPTPSASNIEWLTKIADRTRAAFQPALERSKAAGFVRVDIEVDDIMACFPMAAALFVGDAPEMSERAYKLLHTALFTAPA